MSKQSGIIQTLLPGNISFISQTYLEKKICSNTDLMIYGSVVNSEWDNVLVKVFKVGSL